MRVGLQYFQPMKNFAKLDWIWCSGSGGDKMWKVHNDPNILTLKFDNWLILIETRILDYI